MQVKNSNNIYRKHLFGCEFHDLFRPGAKFQFLSFLDIIEAKILGSNLIYTHHWTAGDMLVLNNVAHIAGPGSQGSVEVTGLRYNQIFLVT